MNLSLHICAPLFRAQWNRQLRARSAQMFMLLLLTLFGSWKVEPASAETPAGIQATIELAGETSSLTGSCTSAFDAVLIGYVSAGSLGKMRCGRVVLDGKRISVRPTSHTLPQPVPSLIPIFPPLNNVVGYAREDSAAGIIFRTTGFSEALADGRPLNVRGDARYYSAPGPFEWFQCPQNMVILGFYDNRILCATLWSSNTTGAGAGTVNLRHYETHKPCTLLRPNGTSGEPWTYHLVAPNSPCLVNTADSFELQNMPSATRILLTQDGGCTRSGDFWAELRTTSKSVTFDFMPLDDIFAYGDGSIIRPGLQLVASKAPTDNPASKRLQCVRITTSSAPPSS